MGIHKCLLVLIHEGITIGKVEVCFGQGQQILVGFGSFGCFEGLLEVLYAAIHVGDHVCVLRQIVEYSVHDAFREDNVRHKLRHTALQKVLALAQHAPSRTRLVRFHEFHGSIMAH